MSEYTRRRLLALGGAGVAGAVAGCSGPGTSADADREADPGSEPADAAQGPVLETITLQNLSDDSQTLDVLIQWDDGDGEFEYWETHELSAVTEGSASSLSLDSGWPTERGPFQLTVRLSNSIRAGFSSTQLADRDCLDLVVLISSDEELSILTDVSGGSCSASESDENETATETSDE